MEGYMKKTLIVCSLFLFTINLISAEDQYSISAVQTNNTLEIYENNITQNTSRAIAVIPDHSGYNSDNSWVDTDKGLFYASRIKAHNFIGNRYGYTIYDYVNNTYVQTDGKSDSHTNAFPLPYGTDSSTIEIIRLEKDANNGTGKIVMGALDISDSSGNTIIEKKSDGSIHIGENSIVTHEVGGRQLFYATDVTGKRIDINIPSGTNLLIDGEDVMGSIDSSIALGAAFASLPTGAEGAGYTCGLGTGFHDSASAISGGCGFDFANYTFVDSMPELFQKASFNIGAASVVHGEGDDATLKAGITFKFGAPKPVREAKDNNLLIENKIDAVMAENDLLKAQIAEINTQLKALNMLAMN